MLAFDAEKLAACGQNADLNALAQDRLDDARGFLDEMLAVVDDEQNVAAIEMRHDDLEGGPLRHQRQRESRGDLARNELGTAQRCEVHEPDAVFEVIEEIRCHVERDARLSDAACTRYRDEPASAHERADFVNASRSSDERADLRREVVAIDGYGAKGREIRG